MLFPWSLALFFSGILVIYAAEPVEEVGPPFVSYDGVDRTEIAAIVTRISTKHGSNSLLLVLNEYGGSQLMRQSVCRVVEESRRSSYGAELFYCRYVPDARIEEGRLTLEAAERLRPLSSILVGTAGSPQRITFQLAISRYKSFTRLNLKFKRPRRETLSDARKGWTRVTQVKSEHMDCTAGDFDIKCLWVPENEDDRLLDNSQLQR